MSEKLENIMIELEREELSKVEALDEIENLVAVMLLTDEFFRECDIAIREIKRTHERNN
jgi:hypothetical protein